MRPSTRRAHATNTIKIVVALFGLITTVSSAACSSANNTPVAQSTWQITNVYISNEYPNTLPASIAGQATMVFGESTIAGFSGCAPFQARVEFSKDGTTTDSHNATNLNFKHMRADKPQCDGAELFYHEKLIELLDGDFEIRHEANDELLLVKHTDNIDNPAIRLASISTKQ